MHQLHAIQKALGVIEAQLKEPLRLDTLARRVGMSHWHFQRTFTAMTGEPAGSYLRRRRLTEAARTLRASNRTILEVALEYRFESHEVFTRAFKAQMNTTPSAWRAGRASVRAGLNRIWLTAEILNHRYRHMNLIPEIVTLPRRTFIGLEVRFVTALSPKANNMKVIPKLWETFWPRVHEIAANETGASYGLCVRPALPDERPLLPDEAFYLAALQVNTEAAPPPGMVKWASPGGTFAKFTHRGPVEKIGETMGFIYAKWLPAGDYTRGKGPDIERMDARFNPRGIDSVLEIFIPVQAKDRRVARVLQEATERTV